jgi:hypothetical protein
MTGPPDDVVSQAALRQYLDDVCPADYVEDVLQAAREHLQEGLPFYSDSLRAAFAEVQPVFTRERYAELFWHCATRVPGWIARVVLANGRAEGEGSEKLLWLWREVDYNRHVEDQVLAHARDESRHSRIFVRLTERAFPGVFPGDQLERFEAALPDVRRCPHEKAPTRIPEQHLIDNLVQMNIGEIRTRLHMHLFAPVIYALAPDEHKLAVRRLLEGLVRDEVRHIGYTAKLMETWAEEDSGKLIRRLYRGRLHAFNRITVEQTESAILNYGQGRFPDLLEI